jgi:hypothetical protein
VQRGDPFDDVRLERRIGQRGLVPSVRMKVGATQLTLIPYRPHSTARHFVRWAIAAFVMQ